MIVRKAFHQASGLIIRGEQNIALARELEQKGLVIIEESSRMMSGIMTLGGREAWQNAGLIAAGRPPVIWEKSI